MQLYDLKVRLSGSIQNEVLKTEATVPEIIVLRHIHGYDAVTNIKPADFDEGRTNRKERERLLNIYGPRTVLSLFPHEYVNMPQETEGAGMSEIDTLIKKSEQPVEETEALKEATKNDKKPAKVKGKSKKDTPKKAEKEEKSEDEKEEADGGKDSLDDDEEFKKLVG